MAFKQYGIYYGHTEGATSELIRLPADSGVYRKFLAWGHESLEWTDDPVEGGLHQDPPNTGSGSSIALTLLSESLYSSPYDVPENATAVRLLLKGKAKPRVTFPLNNPPQNPECDLYVRVSPAGGPASVNECLHAHAMKRRDDGLAIIDLNTVTIDVELGTDGKIEFFVIPTILDYYGTVQLVAYLSGYYAPPETEE